MSASRRIALLGVSALVVASCGSGDGSASTTTVPPATAATTTTTPPVVTTPPATEPPPGPTTIEVGFTAGEFELVGDLVLPGGDGPHPAVILVSGSGPQTRTSIPDYATLKRKLSDAGFAVFSWDKPGSGESKGEVLFAIGQGAEILVAGIAHLRTRADIDPTRIGLWGLSQAGWIMPHA